MNAQWVINLQHLVNCYFMICIIDYLIIATLKLVMLSNFTQLMPINTATYKLTTALGVQLQDTNCIRSSCLRIIQIRLFIMHDDCHSWWLHTKNKTLLDCLMVLLFYIPTDVSFIGWRTISVVICIISSVYLLGLHQDIVIAVWQLLSHIS